MECPHCKAPLVPRHYHGYYDSFSCWTCKCQAIPESTRIVGGYYGDEPDDPGDISALTLREDIQTHGVEHDEHEGETSSVVLSDEVDGHESAANQIG